MSHFHLTPVKPGRSPYPLKELRMNDGHLMSMGQLERKKLCQDTRNRMQLCPSPELAYTPQAHVYKFDGKEEWLAVRCPTLPPLYISHELINGSIHHWHVWTLRPATETYEFRFKTAAAVATSDDDTINWTLLPSTTHYFYQLDALKRWYLCREARRMVRYPVEEIDRDDTPDRPNVYTFLYATAMWTEDYYLVFECFGGPRIYLRTGDLENDTKVIWIVLVGNGEDGGDESESTDSTNSSRDSSGTSSCLEEYVSV